MKKKGFTLIELLAVIVILAIIALIAVPSVLNIIEDSKQGAAEASARNIVSAAKTYYMQSVMKGTSVQDFDLSENTLKYDGDQASKGTIIFENGKASGKMYISGYCVEVDTNGNVSSEKIAEEDCTIENIVEPEELKGEAYALLLDNSSNSADSLPLIFVRSETEIKAGDTYESDYYGSIKVKEVYTGFETEVYASRNFYPFLNNTMDYVYILDTPWSEHSIYITSVIVEDTIRFASVSSLFEYFLSLNYADVTKIDISKNTSLYATFAGVGMSLDNNRYHLSGCFGNDDCWVGGTSATIVGLENWNTSNITDMSWLFGESHINSIDDISKWNTSNVTDMSGMFFDAYGTFNLKIAGWNTSNVTDMSNMFSSGGLSSESLDLSNWNVDKVTEWRYFNYGTDENIIAPAKFADANNY